MKRSEAPAMVYLVFDSNGQIIFSTNDEHKAYQEKTKDESVVTYEKV